MKKLVFINACIRGEQSRTLRIAKPLIDMLSNRYEISLIDLTNTSFVPITAELFYKRGVEGLSADDVIVGRIVAEADRIVVAAPFWDMSFPSVLKTFFEHISAPDLTFSNNGDGSTKGNCKAEKMLYITTRGMDIETDSPLDQGSSYLRALGWLWGIPKLQTVAVCGTDVNDKDVVDARLEEAIKAGIKICEEF